MNFFNAAFSKSISNIVCSPINVLKTRVEVVGNFQDMKLLASFKKIYRNEGISGKLIKSRILQRIDLHTDKRLPLLGNPIHSL
jgi:hypothetical protein